MITIKVNGNWAHINASREIILMLDDELSPYVPNAVWIERQHERHYSYNEKCVLCRNSGWDLRKHFVYRNGRFPAGLLNRVINILSNYGVNDVVVEDYRVKPAGKPWEHKVTLREDQRALADALIDAFSRGERGCIEAATAFGKTIVNVVLAAELGVKTLVITPTRELAAQYADRFIEHGGMEASIWKGLPPWKMGIINIATQQILYRHLSHVSTLDIPFVIVDEAHHAASRTWYKTLMEIGSYYRLGQSATFPNDDWSVMHIEACLGPILSKITAKQMGNNLAATKVFLVDMDDGLGFFDTGVYLEEYRRRLVCSDIRNGYIESLIRSIVKEDLKAMVLCAWGEHVENIFARCIDLYPKVDWVIASQDSDKKVHEKKQALDGDKNVLIATTIFDEGVDVPNLDVIIMAGGGMAEGRTKQRVGRVRRLGRTGKGAVIDFYDNHRIMRKHSEARTAIYAQDGCEVVDCGQAPPDSVIKLVVEWINNQG